MHGRCSAAFTLIPPVIGIICCCKIPAAKFLLQHGRSMCLSPQLSTQACRQASSVYATASCAMVDQSHHCTCLLQELFLHSPCPTAALQMRKDLQHWPQALSLANQLDPTQIPPLACNYAQVSSVCFYTKRHAVCLQHRSSSTAWVSSRRRLAC